MSLLKFIIGEEKTKKVEKKIGTSREKKRLMENFPFTQIFLIHTETGYIFFPQSRDKKFTEKPRQYAETLKKNKELRKNLRLSCWIST